MSLLSKYKSNYKELTTIIYKQEKQIQFLETKALHLSMFYVAVQLLIFLSNSKPSAHQCRNWWKPFALSVSIALLFGFNFAVTISKYMRIKYAQERNYLDQGQNYHLMARLERLGGFGNNPGSDTGLVSPTTSMETDSGSNIVKYSNQEPDMFGLYQRYAHVGVTIFVLMAYTVLVLHTCGSSPCAP